MYRVGITTQKGEIISENFPTKDECDTFILETMEKEDIKKAIIQNQQNTYERYIENF